MKKLISIIGVFTFIISLGISNVQAQNPNNSQLKKKINTYMSFPLLAEDEMIGEVAVSFNVTNKGKINVLKIDSSNPDLIPFVMRRLDKVVIPLNDATIGTTQSYIFNFKKEDNVRT